VKGGLEKSAMRGAIARSERLAGAWIVAKTIVLPSGDQAGAISVCQGNLAGFFGDDF